MYVIGLHGDRATPEMLRRDMGDLESILDCAFDAHGWKRYRRYFDKLVSEIKSLQEPPLMLGYSRGVSVIAALSEIVELRGAILYEGAILNSWGVGGTFPVLQIWNDQGVRYGPNRRRREKAEESIVVWSRHHPVSTLIGVGRHFNTNPLGHAWDVQLNAQISEWIRTSCP